MDMETRITAQKTALVLIFVAGIIAGGFFYLGGYSLLIGFALLLSLATYFFHYDKKMRALRLSKGEAA